MCWFSVRRPLAFLKEWLRNEGWRKRAPRPRAEMMNEVEHVTKPRNCMKTSFFKIFWDESSWIISIAWKEATSAMTDGIQSRASHTALEIYDVDLPRITSDED